MANAMSAGPALNSLFRPELCEIGYNDAVSWFKMDYQDQFEGGICSICRGPRGRRNCRAAVIVKRPRVDFSSLEGDPALRILISTRVRDFLASIAAQRIDFIETVLENGEASGFFEISANPTIRCVAARSDRPPNGWYCPQCGRRSLFSYHPKLRNKLVRFFARRELMKIPLGGAIIADTGIRTSIILPVELVRKHARKALWKGAVFSAVAILDDEEIDAAPVLPSVVDVNG